MQKLIKSVTPTHEYTKKMSIAYSELESHVPVAFCACYIDDRRRLETLMCMICSWRAQTMSCPLHLAISVPDESMQEHVEEILTYAATIYKSEGAVFSFQIHNERKSQFEGYKSLVDSFRIALHAMQWIVFSDDADIWHPERIETYAKMCYKTNRHTPHINTIDCAICAESGRCQIDKAVKTAEFADMMVKCGKAKIVKGNKYVTNCVRFERLALFMDSSTKELLTCPLADVRFKTFLTSDCDEKKRVVITPANEAIWMYYYRTNL